MKFYDFLHKYGWDAMPILSGLGVNLLANANIYFVDSGATNTLNANDLEHGNSWDTPFATLNYAISRCTDDQGDIILVAPGHAETIEDTGTASGTTTDELVVDKSGINIIGLGNDSLRPTFTFGTATDACCVVAASNVTIKNLIFVGDLEDLADLMTLSATSDGFFIEGCEFRDGGSSKETINQIHVTADCDRITIKNCRFFTTNGGSSTDACIWLAGGSDKSRIVDNYFHCDSNTHAVIDGSTAASTELEIARNVIHQHDAAAGLAIAVHASTTGPIYGNLCHGGKDGTSPISITAMDPYENYVTNAEGASGVLSPGADS